MDLKVQRSILSGAAIDVRSGASSLENSLNALETDLNQLAANWTGEAQISYFFAQQKWAEGMRGLKAVLHVVSSLVDQANDSYTQADQFNARMIEDINVTGGLGLAKM